MEFDLNKNDGSGNKSANKKGRSSKFDLSKAKADSLIIAVAASKMKQWIFGLAAILILSSGIWLFLSNVGKVKTKSNSVKEVVTTDSIAVATADISAKVPVEVLANDTTGHSPGTVTKQPVVTDNSAEAASLNNKIVAGFATGSSAFSRIDQSLVKRIVSYLRKYPNASIIINGYASSEGSLSVNQVVSQSRADAFKRLLISKNIAESRISAAGKGIQNPIASNVTRSGRQKNRRIEIML